MKINRKISVAVLTAMLMVGFSVNSYGMSKPKPPKVHKHYHHQKQNGNHCKPGTNVPLDGGILTVLIGGGIAYFVARKKKKKE
jgi:hypothetical protein